MTKRILQSKRDKCEVIFESKHIRIRTDRSTSKGVRDQNDVLQILNENNY